MNGRLWPWRAAVVAVVAVAVGVRVYGLEAPVLSHDEAFSWRLSNYAYGELCRRSGADVHPHLYYALLKAWTEVFGDSVAALRGLSLLFGIFAVLALYQLVVEALRDGEETPASPAVRSGALFACLLLALAPAQVAAAQNARMYSLGVLLAALTGWLLLRACRSGAGYWLWWAAYGLAAGLFCYTHNYAFFTLFGQSVFVIGWVCLAKKLTGAQRRHVLLGFGYATLLAVILYLPWLPVLLEQIRQVKANYWIEPLTLPLVERTLFTWGTGLPYQEESWAFLAVLAAAIGLVLWRARKAGAFFLLQAFSPFVLSVGLSLASGRSIFLAHYLVFAHVALLALWGVVWAALPGWPERAALACTLATASVAGLATHVDGLPAGTPAVAKAAQLIRERIKPGDEVWTGTAWELNQLLFYLGQAGARDVKVRCRQSPFPGEGHMVHIASLRAEDVLWDRPEPAAYPQRVWVVGAAAPEAGKMELVLDRTFSDARRSAPVTLYVRTRP